MDLIGRSGSVFPVVSGIVCEVSWYFILGKQVSLAAKNKLNIFI